jgi:hypothetical protein
MFVMTLRAFNLWLVIFFFVALFPTDAVLISRYVWLQIKISLLDAYMFTRSYILYRQLRAQGIDVPFRYKSIRNRKPL